MKLNYKITKKQMVLFSILFLIIPPLYYLYELFFQEITSDEEQLFPILYIYLIIFFIVLTILYLKQKK